MIVTIVGHGVATSAGDRYPGEVVDLPDAEAKRLVARGRAQAGEAAPATPPAAPSVTPPGVVETRDPAPRARGKR